MISSEPPKETRLHIRTSSQQKALLARAARSRQLKVSQFVLQTSLEAAQKLVQEEEAQTLVRVSAEQFDRLMQKLEEPAQENPALRQLLGEPTSWNG